MRLCLWDKEELFLLQSYVKFDEKRKHFLEMKLDKDIREHMGHIFSKIDLSKEMRFTW